MYILILSIFTDCFFKASLASLAQLPFAPNPRLFSTDFHTIRNLFLRCFLRGDSLVMVTNYRVKQLLLSHMSITKLKNTRNAKDDDDCCHLVDVKAFFIKKNWWARPSNIKKISKLYCPRGKMKVTIKWRSKGEWNSRGFEFLSQRHFHSKTCFYKKWLFTWPPFFSFFIMILEPRFRSFRLIFKNKMAAMVLISLYRSRLGPPGV